LRKRWKREAKEIRPAEVKPAEEKPAEKPHPAAAAVIEAMPIGVGAIDLGGRMVQVNEAALKMFGYEKDEMIGRLCTEFVPEEDVPRALEAVKECIEKGHYRGFEGTGATKDGRKFSLLGDATLLKDPEGNPSSIITTFRDITELKRAEERVAALKRAAEGKINDFISAQKYLLESIRKPRFFL